MYEEKIMEDKREKYWGGILVVTFLKMTINSILVLSPRAISGFALQMVAKQDGSTKGDIDKHPMKK